MRKRNFKPKKEPKLFTALHSIVLTLCKIDFLPIKKKKKNSIVLTVCVLWGG
jgi:hypothetical protein